MSGSLEAMLRASLSPAAVEFPDTSESVGGAGVRTDLDLVGAVAASGADAGPVPGRRRSPRRTFT